MLDPRETDAVNSITQALDALEPDGRVRVMLYLRGMLDGMGMLPRPAPMTPAISKDDQPKTSKAKLVDIRQLRTDKSPRSDVEMAAIVAYYLREEAPDQDRKDSINKTDVEKYFKQAHHPLPKRAGLTLTNAKNAGYLDQDGQGEYRLNAVGYNLVAHGLPAKTDASKRPRRKTVKPQAPRSKRQPAKKTSRPPTTRKGG